jgi:G3E family GTPase
MTTSMAEDCDHPHHHRHDDDVKSFVFRSDRPFDPLKLEDFLGAVVNIYGPRMLRYKGVLHMKGTERKVIFQGVHQLMAATSARCGPRARRAAARWCSSASTCRRIFFCRACSSAWREGTCLRLG